MRNLDPKSLRLLVAVCDLKSIRKAAEQENIEPSAISKRIAQLESAVGTQLLVRGRRATQPTAAGLTLLEHARTMLFVMQRIESDMTAFSGEMKGHVRLVASISTIAGPLLEDIASFMRQPTNRHIKVDIEERLSRDLVRVVKDGGASLGACWDTADFESLEHLPYGGDELAVAVPLSHPLARRASVAFAQTLDFEHVGLPPTTAVNAMLQRVAVRSGRLVQYRVIVSSFDAAYRAVAAGLGISVLPRQLAPYYASAGLLSIPLSDAWAKRRFAICFRDLKSMPAPARRLVEHLAG
jgi:DNA-binding transcriptional LysR family regulator